MEISLDERGTVWTVLHSGSRGLGNQLATYHIGKAKRLMREYLTTVPDPDHAHFTEGTPESGAYIRDMLWARRYAYESRARMNRALLRSLAQAVSPKRPAKEKAITVQAVNWPGSPRARSACRPGGTKFRCRRGTPVASVRR